MAHRKRRACDHRVKAQIIATGNPHLLSELQIPLSTSRSWSRRGVGAVVTFDAPVEGEAQLRDRIAKLEQRVAKLAALLGLVLALLRATIDGRMADLAKYYEARRAECV